MELVRSLARLSAPAAAQRLLGCELVRLLNGKELRVKIVETEAYDQTDAASAITTTRIGIKKAMKMPWRFYLTRNTYVSKI